MKEMSLAERAGENQICLRARRLNKVPRIFDDDVRLVAISGQFRRYAREQVVEDADYLLCVSGLFGTAPLGDVGRR